MRTFIAIALPHDIKESLEHLQKTLKTAGADVKWVEPNNIHLTLKFLGEVDEKKVERIEAILEETAGAHSSYHIRVSGAGAFPRISSPRVIWVGMDYGVDETTQIAKELEVKIAKIGIPKENRPFSCHITIGRTRSGMNLQKLAEKLQALHTTSGIPPQEFPVTKLTLYKSTLTPPGPVYEVLKEANLIIT